MIRPAAAHPASRPRSRFRSSRASATRSVSAASTAREVAGLLNIQCIAGVGACCFGDGSCTPETAADCATLLGDFQGEGSDCFNPEGNPTTYGPSSPGLPIGPGPGDPAAVDTITVLGGPSVVGKVTVSVDITHTWVGDLVISLTHDDSATTVLLQDDACGSQNDEVITFDDDAVDPIGTLCAEPYVGSFSPQNPLSTFVGLDANSGWTLTVSDDAGGDSGTLNSWSLTIDGSVPKCVPAGVPNDDCVNRIDAFDGDNPYDTTGSTLDTTVQAPSDGNMQTDIWYNYTATCTGTAVIGTCEGTAGPDTVLEVYDGCVCDLVMSTLAVDDDTSGCGVSGFSSEVAIPVVQGECYKIRLSGWNGSEVSGLLNIECLGGPDNDLCENRIDVGNGDTPFSTVGAGTDGPAHPDCLFFGDDQVQSDIWFNYTAPASGDATISLCGSSYDTKLAVYEGCECADLSDATLLACNDDSCSLQSEVTIPVNQGQCYKIRVGGFGGIQGDGILSIDGPSSGFFGACCLGEVCSQETYDDCVALGGVYQGNGTSCTPNPCECTGNEKSFLTLGIDPNGYNSGDRVNVTVNLEDACTIPVAGWQGFLEYDSNALTFNSVSYTAAPFGLWIITSNPLLNPSPGILNLAAGIDQSNGQAPVNGNYLLATLNFTANGFGCIPDVQFRTNFPPSRTTDIGGTEISTNTLGLPSPQCLGDTNGDGQVNVTDLITVINNWGSDNCIANLDGLCENPPGTGCVNVLDLIIVITNWGPCP